MLTCPRAVSLVPFSIKTLKVLSRTTLFKCIYTLIKLLWWHSSKESACNAGATGDMSSIPESGRSPGGGHSNPVQCSCLQNPMDRGAWQATVRGVARVGHDWATKPPPPVSPQVTQTQLIWELYFKDYWDREILWEKRSKGKRSLMAPEHRVRKKRIILFWAFIIH